MNKRRKAQPDKPPPLDTIPVVAAGPALRQITVVHGRAVMHNGKEQGLFWNCPGCNQRRDVYGQQPHNQLASGREVVVRCSCGAWARATRNNIEIVRDMRAIDAVRGALEKR